MPAPQQPLKTHTSIAARLWDDRWIYLFLLPTVLLIGSFTIYPVAASVWYSMLDWNGFGQTGAFVGLANYRELWADPLFWNAFGNTLTFLVLAVPLRVALALVLAVILNGVFPFVRLFRTGIFLPVVTTAAIVGVVMRYILDPTGGPINIALTGTGLVDYPVNFLGNANLALYSAVVIWVWKWLGITVIYWMAALQTIPGDIYEAAELDGAGAVAKFLRITLPILTPFTIIITLITVIEATNVFDLMLTLTGGGPFYGTEVIDIFVYRQAFTSNIPRLGYASAAAIFFGFAVTLAAAIQILIVTRLRPERAMSGPGSARRRLPGWGALRIAALAVLVVIWCYPFAWLVSASLKDQQEIFAKGLNLIPDALLWDNYARAWGVAGFSGYMLNTVVVTIGTVILVVIHSALSGYVLGRFTFIGRSTLVAVLAATLVIPVGVLIIPIVDLSAAIGLTSSRTGIVLALAGSGQAAAILLYAGYFRGIPKELAEAAELDGARFFRTFFSVMLPLAGPVTATVAVLTFLTAWNAFLIPLVFTFGAPGLRTLPVGMLAFVGSNETDWSGMAAAATISLLPVVVFFFFMQRYFVEGIAGAVKQ